MGRVQVWFHSFLTLALHGLRDNLHAQATLPT